MKVAFLLGIWLGMASCWGEPLQVEVRGSSAILMNGESRAILLEKDAYTPRYPASTTKIATALYALYKKGGELGQVVSAEPEALVSITPDAKRKAQYTLPAYWQESDGTHIGIKQEEELLFEDLLRGLLIASGNDAANVIAQFVSGTIPQFMAEVNQFLKELGCQQTTFCNPHGLHHPQHQTTAYDLALMTKAALKHPTFCQIVAQTRFFRPKTNKQKAMTLNQTNRLLLPGKFHYAKAIGVKTGYHSKAKHNFVAAARAGERTLILVLMGYQQRSQIFEDAIKIFDTAFNQPKVRRTFLAKGPQSFSYALAEGDRPLKTYLAEDVQLDYYPAEDPQAKCFLYWETLAPPIQKEQKVGEIRLLNPQGELLAKASLLALEEVQLTWFYQWITFIQEASPIILILFVGMILLVALWYIVHR